LRLRTAFLLGALLLVAAGCSGSSDSGRSRATTTHEAAKTRTQDVAWLVLLRKWEDRMARRGTIATVVADGVRNKTRKQSELDAAVRPLEQCAATLGNDVGAPLVPRYRESYALYRSACADVAAWGRVLGDAAGSNDVTEVEEKEQQVESSLDEAQRELSSSFRAVGPLPVKGGDVSSSRIEPRFGRALNRLVYKTANAAQIEVRCWSKEDWPKVKYEYGGYAGNVDFAGFAYDQFRVSVAPDYCASLVDLVYRHERPTSGLPFLRTRGRSPVRVRDERGEDRVLRGPARARDGDDPRRGSRVRRQAGQGVLDRSLPAQPAGLQDPAL